MPDQKTKPEYTSNNSFMKSQIKVPKPFGDQYEDPLEKLKSSLTLKINTHSNKPPESENLNHSQTNLTGLTEPTGLSSAKAVKHPVSPVRDFTKTPNSINRQIMAKGLFKGKSKQIYDYLWSVSRGNINPSRTVRRTQNEIQAGSGIGSMNTIKQGIKYLEQIGLLKKNSAIGEAQGNTYEIFTPEEVNLLDQVSPVGSVSPVSPVRQNSVEPVEPVSGLTGLSSNPMYSQGYSRPKTSFKDNTGNDDDSTREAFAKMTEKLAAAAIKSTGKKSQKSESEKWTDLADLLILEFEKAAKHTKSISSFPAFLTEILRRQFFAAKQTEPKKIQNSSKNLKESKPDLIGKSDQESFIIKPLNEDERNQALLQLRDFADDDFLEDFKKWYTEEDWNWIIEKLKD